MLVKTIAFAGVVATALIAAALLSFGGIAGDDDQSNGAAGEEAVASGTPDARLAELEAQVSDLNGTVESLYKEINDYQSLSKETGDGISLYLFNSLESLTASIIQKQVTVEGAISQISLIDSLARQGQIAAEKLSKMTDPRWPVQGAYAENRMICQTAVTYCGMLRSYAEYRNDANLANLNMIRTTMSQQVRTHFPPK